MERTPPAHVSGKYPTLISPHSEPKEGSALGFPDCSSTAQIPQAGINYPLRKKTENRRSTVWLSKEAKVMAVAKNINLSRLLENSIRELAIKNGWETGGLVTPELLLLVQCPCGTYTQTVSQKYATCPACRRAFKVNPKTGRSRIVKVLIGSLTSVAVEKPEPTPDDLLKEMGVEA